MDQAHAHFICAQSVQRLQGPIHIPRAQECAQQQIICVGARDHILGSHVVQHAVCSLRLHRKKHICVRVWADRKELQRTSVLVLCLLFKACACECVCVQRTSVLFCAFFSRARARARGRVCVSCWAILSHFMLHRRETGRPIQCVPCMFLIPPTHTQSNPVQSSPAQHSTALPYKPHTLMMSSMTSMMMCHTSGQIFPSKPHKQQPCCPSS